MHERRRTEQSWQKHFTDTSRISLFQLPRTSFKMQRHSVLLLTKGNDFLHVLSVIAWGSEACSKFQWCLTSVFYGLLSSLKWKHSSNLTDTLLCQHINNRFKHAPGSIICRRCYIRCLLFYGLTASADVTLGERHTQQFPGKWLHLSSAIRWCKNYSPLL